VRLAPGIPRALCFEGEELMHHSGVTRRENTDVCFEVIARSQRVGAKRHPMTGSATKQSTLTFFGAAWIASLRSQ
jgi:hypothetical protein